MMLSRRELLALSAKLSAGLAAAGSLPSLLRAEEPAKKADAPGKLRVAVVGVNGRGMSHVGGFMGKSDSVVTVICDCDEGVVGSAMKKVEAAQGSAPKFVQDLRRVMDDPNVDVVSIATPNHWHALAAIWAMQAGKDVYVEKPVSHNVSEGRRMVEVARKTGRICQTGTQIRSMSGIRAAMEYIHAGKLGTVRLARGLCYKPRGSIGQVKGTGTVPATCDYDLWCGPAPKSPLRRNKLHYDWHWQWETGNGDLGNQGIHQMDVARWGLGKQALPTSALSFGGRFGYTDDGETANTQAAIFRYGDAAVVFEVRGLKTEDLLADVRGKKTDDERQIARVGNVFYGTQGMLICSKYEAAVAVGNDGEILEVFTSKGEDHFGNFVKAVRSRNIADLHADIEEGHLSSAMCHLANISHRLGTDKPLATPAGELTTEKDLAEALARTQAHLKANGVDLEKTPMKAGRLLKIDPATETFVGDKEADAMLTREYRKGFEVPAKA